MDLNFQYPNQPEPVQEENQGLYIDRFSNFVTNIQNCYPVVNEQLATTINFYRLAQIRLWFELQTIYID